MVKAYKGLVGLTGGGTFIERHPRAAGCGDPIHHWRLQSIDRRDVKRSPAHIDGNEVGSQPDTASSQISRATVSLGRLPRPLGAFHHSGLSTACTAR